MEKQEQRRLYKDLSWTWTMWGNPAVEYASYCEFVVSAMKKQAGRELTSLLDIGCGGGKNLFTLKKHFACTGLDISPEMLKLASELNPECKLVLADMRNFELNDRFDAILIDDGISYMLNTEELESVFRHAYKHLKPGGVMFVTPDFTVENFKQFNTQVFHSEPSERYPDTEIVYITSDYLRPGESPVVETTFVYLIRIKGKLTVETDLHLLGIFPFSTWKELLQKAGFEVAFTTYHEDEQQYDCFICVNPLSGEAQFRT
jgi:SAM-dependent methyltransferase